MGASSDADTMTRTTSTVAQLTASDDPVMMLAWTLTPSSAATTNPTQSVASSRSPPFPQVGRALLGQRQGGCFLQAPAREAGRPCQQMARKTACQARGQPLRNKSHLKFSLFNCNFLSAHMFCTYNPNQIKT